MNNQKWLQKQFGSSFHAKTVALTGATGGIGYELCKALLELGANLVMIDRNPQKSLTHYEQLIKLYPDAKIERLFCDLESLKSVHEMVESLKTLNPDIFLHNAGAYRIERRITEDGYDNSFQINFIAPYYILHELAPFFENRGYGHLAVVGSIAHTYSKTRPHDVDFRLEPKPSKVYGNAKRFLMYASETYLNEFSNITFAVGHPGITYTNMTLHYPKWIFWLIRYPMKVIFMKPKLAARSILMALKKPCNAYEWIGPRFFNIWGNPSKKALKTVSQEEISWIYEKAEQFIHQIQF